MSGKNILAKEGAESFKDFCTSYVSFGVYLDYYMYVKLGGYGSPESQAVDRHYKRIAKSLMIISKIVRPLATEAEQEQKNV